MKASLSVNRLAWKLVERLLEDPDYYQIGVERTDSGAAIIDAGIVAKGGFQAGKLITEICMGGCGKAELAIKNYGNFELLSILIHTDHPVIATLGSQYAGWQINEAGYFAIGSGPARALAQKPKDIYSEIGYKDNFEKAIVVLETSKKPPACVMERISKDCRVTPDKLVAILTPTTSLVGATQISGRIVETGIHKLRRLGLDPKAIQFAFGCAPIAPIHPRFPEAMARTNDAILYGGTSYYIVNYDDEKRLERIVTEAPPTVSKAYGKPFMQIFEEARHDFYKIDPDLFAPAELIVNNLRTGNTYSRGKINIEMLRTSFGLAGG
jgi:methenyltetrahydromethanopterin cyclohydrolase